MNQLGPLLAFAVVAACPAAAVTASKAELLRRYDVPEAHQGVAVDARHFYAIANSEIAKYDKASGKRLALWKGDPKVFQHLNSCAVIGRELVCANSNYPDLPMTSSVEVFDQARMVHLRTVPLGQLPGSITFVDRKDGAWWVGLANYDGRGGAPGRDHLATELVKFDANWRPLQTWTYPETVLARLAPRSASGGAWGPDGRLYITGHDRPELYVLALPKTGQVLTHLATVDLPFEGQAFAFDHSRPGVVFGIGRAEHEVLAVRLPR
jgi:hypothetical protein